MDCVVKVKKVRDNALIPECKTEGAAGYDLCACIDETVRVPAFNMVKIPSGLAFDIPTGYFGAIYARSGLATKQGLRPATCVSVIDSDYRGEVGLPMFNDTCEVRRIEPNERIAQIIFQPYAKAELQEVAELDETERGTNGFGSTGR